MWTTLRVLLTRVMSFCILQSYCVLLLLVCNTGPCPSNRLVLQLLQSFVRFFCMCPESSQLQTFPCSTTANHEGQC